jgi:hypothetical protein
MLASAVGGLDQSASCRQHLRSSFVGAGRLVSGRGAPFPDSRRSEVTVTFHERVTWFFQNLPNSKEIHTLQSW